MYLKESQENQKHSDFRLDLLSLEQLRLFVIAARSKSFSEVARICGKTQSTVSIAINNLEIDIGVPLFLRDNRGISLSPEGQSLYPSALDILNRIKVFEQRALHICDWGPDQLTIHMDALFPYARLIDIVAQLEKRHPNVEFAIKVAPPFTAYSNWKDNSEDLAITSRSLVASTGADVRSIAVDQVQFLPVISREHSLAGKEAVSREELEQYRQIVFDVGRNSKMKAAGNRRIVIGGLHCQLNLIKQGAGWGYLPDHFVQKYIDSGELNLVRLIDDAYFPKLSFRLAWHAMAPLKGIKKELVEALSTPHEPVLAVS
ncbi:LysR family transcriptional regulator [Aestuariispira insulae]|uniref:LysR family transcriptional regulator n=1 Tax=Aestuariispira insulae TaxID=1461337 RepID=A0A3D9H1I6_9PROT|nr:LysR family transcriptional regulator [Aestuariispira insulae]RED43354.1 LysR family transcriptional regulator [Aestuariispira insulae]